MSDAQALAGLRFLRRGGLVELDTTELISLARTIDVELCQRAVAVGGALEAEVLKQVGTITIGAKGRLETALRKIRKKDNDTRAENGRPTRLLALIHVTPSQLLRVDGIGGETMIATARALVANLRSRGLIPPEPWRTAPAPYLVERWPFKWDEVTA